MFVVDSRQKIMVQPWLLSNSVSHWATLTKLFGTSNWKGFRLRITKGGERIGNGTLINGLISEIFFTKKLVFLPWNAGGSCWISCWVQVLLAAWFFSRTLVSRIQNSKKIRARQTHRRVLRLQRDYRNAPMFSGSLNSVFAEVETCKLNLAGCPALQTQTGISNLM